MKRKWKHTIPAALICCDGRPADTVRSACLVWLPPDRVCKDAAYEVKRQQSRYASAQFLPVPQADAAALSDLVCTDDGFLFRDLPVIWILNRRARRHTKLRYLPDDWYYDSWMVGETLYVARGRWTLRVRAPEAVYGAVDAVYRAVSAEAAARPK